MVGYLTLILICQLAGEVIVGLFAFPLPGPVLGMVLMFLFLTLRRSIPEGLDRTAGGLLRSMSLLFIPAGVGVMMHFKLLGQSLLPLSVALVISTCCAIVVTGLFMRWLNRGQADG